MEKSVTAAMEPGCYRRFTGYINYHGIEGYAEDADFIILDDYEKYMFGLVRMIWKGGTWLGGRCSLVKWTGGVWKGGTFENGNWHGGVWEDGTFHLSTFHGGEWRNGTFLWSMWDDGTWLGGTFSNSHWENGRWKGGTWEPSSTVDSDDRSSFHTVHLTPAEWEDVRFRRGWF